MSDGSFIEFEIAERIPGQVDQFPELFTSAYPVLSFRNDIKTTPVFVTEFVKARAIRQQVGGAVQEAPPHRFRELFPAGTLKPRARIMLDDPEPISQSEIMCVDIPCITPVTCQ